jgi:hypothetical protein
LDLVAPAITRGQDQYRHRSPGATPSFENGDAVAFGQADVENHGVIGLGVAEEPSIFTVIGPVHGITSAFESGGDLSIEIAVVFDDEQAHICFKSSETLRANYES